MKALVFQGIENIQLQDVPDPKIKDATDAIVRLTLQRSAGPICT